MLIPIIIKIGHLSLGGLPNLLLHYELNIFSPDACACDERPFACDVDYKVF